MAPLYAARAVLPYLLVGNVRGAAHALSLFTDRIVGANAHLGVQDATVAGVRVRIFPSMPLLNFLCLLLLAAQRGKADLFRLLCRHYAAHLKEVDGWSEVRTFHGHSYSYYCSLSLFPSLYSLAQIVGKVAFHQQGQVKIF
jgi:hypothetical protein